MRHRSVVIVDGSTIYKPVPIDPKRTILYLRHSCRSGCSLHCLAIVFSAKSRCSTQHFRLLPFTFGFARHLLSPHHSPLASFLHGTSLLLLLGRSTYVLARIMSLHLSSRSSGHTSRPSLVPVRGSFPLLIVDLEDFGGRLASIRPLRSVLGSCWRCVVL